MVHQLGGSSTAPPSAAAPTIDWEPPGRVSPALNPTDIGEETDPSRNRRYSFKKPPDIFLAFTSADFGRAIPVQRSIEECCTFFYLKIHDAAARIFCRDRPGKFYPTPAALTAVDHGTVGILAAVLRQL